MLEAMTIVVAEQGYPNTSVSDVIARARVSRKTFYEQFTDKQDCFFAAWQDAAARMMKALEGAVATEGTWPERMRLAIELTLDHLASEPESTRMLLVEMRATGTAGRELTDAVHHQFAVYLRAICTEARRELPGMADVTDRLARAIVGASVELATDHIIRNGAETLSELSDDIVAIVWTLIRGPVEGPRR